MDQGFDGTAGTRHISGMSHFHLTHATVSDLPFIMATERLDGYDAFVGRWSEDKHRAALADGRHAYFLGKIDDEPIGFVILRDWASSERVTLLKRVAVSKPGQGFGRQLLGAVVELVFRETDAHRLWLGTYPENSRARHVYESVGFIPEGVARDHVFFGGIHRDELIMAILRTDRRKLAE
ncbi:GNAT family N-acetyltransferase [Acidocella sp.]|jgi:RimJ/RimL family protein N-acetyltransferase|uniref:GNAT family N-acetyltransferase n=1 Tax=Acidocella sp. TaxID=50710 RepID=UPI002F424A31